LEVEGSFGHPASWVPLESEVHDVRPMIRGAVAGLAGTALMTGAMLAAKKAGMAPGELARKERAENLEKKIRVYDRLPKGPSCAVCSSVRG